jgi:hypothetical protein
MKKLPKFQVQFNPMVDASQKFIFHTRSPEMLIRVLLIDDLTKEQDEDIRARYPLGTFNKVPGTRYILIIEKFYNEIDTEEKKADLAGVLKRAADWWVAYLKFEERKKTDVLNAFVTTYNEGLFGQERIHENTVSDYINGEL